MLVKQLKNKNKCKLVYTDYNFNSLLSANITDRLIIAVQIANVFLNILSNGKSSQQFTCIL